MKNIFRKFAITIIALYLLNTWFPHGLQIQDPFPKTLLLLGATITVLTLTVKPLINLILPPLNLFSFNAFRWLTEIIVLWLAVALISTVRVGDFSTIDIPLILFTLPGFHFKGLFAYIGLAVINGLIHNFIIWLFLE